MQFETSDEIWDELYEISSGQVNNGFQRLEEMYKQGLINQADYEDAKNTLSNYFYLKSRIIEY